MKKNISINISGIIFHIEEDGYENLRKYLDSINKYFSTFEDSTEIMADIESRIAEIFLSRLNEGKQVITADDVASLITTMGSVSDFKAAEQDEFDGINAGAPRPQESTTGSAGGFTGSAYASPKSLERDQKRKILGGVCSGIGHYMNVDPVWIRLLFAIFAFAWGFTIFVYIVMWIVVPGSYDLTEIEVGKKMFRDPERKVLGGVSGGVASFLNIDILAVRILFVILTITGGLGLFLYIILWVILPEARTLTDRMQMQGEPVTLSNIESNIKKNQLEPDREESAATKILLFPFRVIGIVLQALAKIIGPLVEALRVVIGIMIMIMGISLLLSVLVSGGIAFGIISGAGNIPWATDYNQFSIPVDAFMRAFPGWVITAAFISAIIPPLFIILLGISTIARRIVFSATVGWSLFVLFILCSAMLAVGIPKIVMAFKEEGEHRIETNYTPTGKTTVLRIRETGLDDYHGSALTLKGHTGSEFKLQQNFRAQGSTRLHAIENAKMVDYNVTLQDSVFTFDSNITFRPDAVFRGQELDMILYIPYNKPFIIENGMVHLLDQYIEYDARDGQTWEMTDKGLRCITCPQPTEEEVNQADLHDFDELDMRGIFDVKIYRGNEYAVELKGPESEKLKYNIFRSGKTLVIDFEGKKNFDWDLNMDKVLNDKVHISITMPELEKIEATGFGSIDFEKFYSNDLELQIRGPIKVSGEVESEDVMINLNAKSEVDLRGTTQSMLAEIQLGSKLKAYDLEVQEAVIEVKGASSAKVNVVRRLEMETGVASDIDYRGNPEVIKRN